MAEEDPAYTIVEYTRDHSGYKCGYCKSTSTNFSHGMWAHKMTVLDYQDLIDRGWRRSGKYCYKPTMDKTCCPMYAIKCDALELRLSKAQKKVLKRMHRYLSFGDVKFGGNEAKAQEYEGSGSNQGSQEYVKPKFNATQDLSSLSFVQSPPDRKGATSGDKEVDIRNINNSSSVKAQENSSSIPDETRSNNFQDGQNNCVSAEPSSGVTGPDPSKPQCRKAKLVRRERREAKLAKRRQEAVDRGESLMEVTKPKATNNTPMSLEDFLNKPLPENSAHKLEVRLVRSHPSSEALGRSCKCAHEVYQKYQINIHGDSPEKCSESQYKRFLCNSPLELRLVRVNPPEASFRSTYNSSYAVYRNYQLQIHHDSEYECDRSTFQSFLVDGPLVPWHPRSGPSQGYGSFHHQYWLDGRLIAVGVLDVLPYCISSVYLYYDPEFSFLSLGTYASLRELALTRELHRAAPRLKWYYMGFYIYSCPKMRYKGNYSPSYLLCPETYVWVPLHEATAKLDIAKYSRFNEDVTAVDMHGDVDLSKIKVLFDCSPILYETYCEINPDADEDEEVQEYATLVGARTAHRMMLYRS
ncbi:Arginyl-tRNA--protein transferase 1 [Halocaridina rubra]|uniref:Arginyl-tRNA--protein transferase 1 n=1 Tax=Halocaridina rubra TaxID=373956 RepID=A0AAN9FU79_HALRR